jgi:hypothetical protein
MEKKLPMKEQQELGQQSKLSPGTLIVDIKERL